MLRLNKYQLDNLASLVGLVGGVSVVLTAQGYLKENLGLSISGICVVLNGYLTNKPANARPDTDDAETREQRKADG